MARQQQRNDEPTPSEVHRLFVSEPMGVKPVEALAGIGTVLGGQLRVNGYDMANLVLAKFLELRRDEVRFKQWLREVAQPNRRHCAHCYRCIRDWCDAHL